MNQRHSIKLGLVGVVTAALAGSTLGVAPAQAADESARKAGNRSLATVLAADSGFDRKWTDFDIVEQAVLTVLDAKPDSAVKVLTQGGTRLTAFVPNDRAFRRLAHDLTGKRFHSEKSVFNAIASVADVDTLETVLLYHVAPGKTLNSRRVVALNNKEVTTALGSKLTVRVRGGKVFLNDADRNDPNPRVVALDINKGNKQIAHGINLVLRPIDL
ncbi:fasciclin domain-containing protein [Nocardioides pacificus]